MALLSPHSEELGSRRRRTAAYVDTESEGESEALPVRARRFGEHDGTPTITPPTQSYGPFGAGDADSHLDDSHSDVLLRGRRPHPAADDDDACAYHLPPLPHSFGAGPDCEAGCTRESEVGEEQQDRVLTGNAAESTPKYAASSLLLSAHAGTSRPPACVAARHAHARHTLAHSRLDSRALTGHNPSIHLPGIGERGFGYFLHTRPLQRSLPAQRETVPR